MAELESRSGTAAEVAAGHGVPRAAPYIWRREIMGDDVGGTEEKGAPASRGLDDLPDDIGALQDTPREVRMRLGKARLELDVRQAALEIVRKGPGADPELPTSAEKAATAGAPRAEYGLCEIPPVMGMAKSSHEHARDARAKGETEGRAAARKAVVEALGASGGTYGHRRIAAVAGAGERAVRGIMRDEGLVARAAKKKRRRSPYEDEVSEAPPGLPRDEGAGTASGPTGPTSCGSPTWPSSASPPARCASRPSWTASTACR